MTPENNVLATHRGPGARAGGFTLIELMIVLVIAAILVTVAVPIYLHQVQESRRTDARSALLDLAAREERFYATNNAYSNTASDLGYQGWGSGNPVGNGQYYYIDQPTVNNAATPPSFSLTAHPVSSGPQANDGDCTSFTVNSSGQQSATGSSASSCWPQ